jgi:fumarate reductase flavoprotein subunit
MTSVGELGIRPVIVGGGTAGLAAAVRLGELGVSTLLLDKEPRLGGQLHLSSGAFSAAGTARQQSRGIVDTAEEHRADVARIGRGLGTPHLIALATEQAAHAVDWLDRLGFNFAPECPTIVRGHEPYGRPRTYWGVHSVNGGAAIYETLRRHLDTTVVDVCLGTQVERIEIEAGAVTGLDVCGPDGRRTVPASIVILASGGYAASRELLTRFQPDYASALVGCLPHATGDGHRMLLDLDVPMTGYDTYVPTMGMIEDPDRRGFALSLTHARLVVDAHGRLPWEIWVNQRGERFVDETGLSPDRRERALLEQPGLVMWGLWDEGTLTRAPTPPIGPDWTADQIRTGRPWLVRADSLAELADRTGLSLPTLQETIRCYAARDIDRLGRTFRPTRLDTPPYYAVRTVGGMLLSRGGPVVDDLLRPLTASGTSIEGLHAIGELLGMGQFSGDAFAGGMSVGPALSFGYWIAEQIAAGR